MIRLIKAFFLCLMKTLIVIAVIFALYGICCAVCTGGAWVINCVNLFFTFTTKHLGETITVISMICVVTAIIEVRKLKKNHRNPNDPKVKPSNPKVKPNGK